MKSQKREPDVMTKEPCVVCCRDCLPYGFTSEGKYVCSRMCSDKWDSLKFQPDMFLPEGR